MISVKQGGNKRHGLPRLISRICAGYNLPMIGTNLGGPWMIKRSSIEKMMPSTVRDIPIPQLADDADEFDLLQIELAETKEKLARDKKEIVVLKEKVEYVVAADPALEEKFDEIERDHDYESE